MGRGVCGAASHTWYDSLVSLLSVGGVVLAMTLTVAGPPPLPPLPGQSGSEPAPRAGPLPQRPAPKAPAPASVPEASRPAPTPNDAARPGPEPQGVEAPATDEFTRPVLVEPPQPEPIAPSPPEPPPGAHTTATEAPRMKDGPGRIGEEESLRVPLPPPERPPHSGVGLFATAGVLFALAVVEQAVGQVLVQRRCIDPLEGMVLTPEDLDDAVFTCTSGVLPAFILQIHAGLNIVGAMALTAGGGGLRAERDAWDDVFKAERNRAHAKLRGTGVSLIAGGFGVWLTSSAVTFGLMVRCNTGGCVRRNRITGFVIRDVGFAMMTAGVGLLTYGEIYRRRRGLFDRERRMTLSPMAFGEGGGFVVGGRF